MPNETAPDKPEATVEKVEGQTQAEEPQGAETDWKAEARKWEQRAKENRRELEGVQKALDGYQSKEKDEAAKEKTAAEALEAAQSEIKRLRAEHERDQLVREVAKAQGVDVDILIRMRGESKEEVEANAELLRNATKPSWPEVKDRGRQESQGLTKEEILAIKDDTERVNAIAKNLDKFRK